MVLQRAEVVHLVAVGVVQRDLLGAAALAYEAGIGTHTCVVATQCHRGQQRSAVAFAGGLLVAQLPDVVAQQVDAQVRHAGSLRSVQHQARDDQRIHIGVRLEALDHRELAVLTAMDHQARVERPAIVLE